MNEVRAKIVAQLQTGPHKFSYRKKDQSLRLARGTLHPSYLPQESDAERSAREQRSAARAGAEDVVHYFDLDQAGFRQFNIANLVDLPEPFTP